MIFSNKWVVSISAVLAMLAVVPVADAKKAVPDMANPDDTFLALRNAARYNDAGKAAEYAARLSSYAIPSYVDYYRLKPRIGEASIAEIREFLARYDGSAIGDRLRNDWLLDLGQKRSWTLFDAQYPLFALDDDTQLKCYALMSKANKGQNVADDARALLLSPREYGEACTALIATLVQARQFSANDVWAQIRLAGEANLSSVARRLAASIDAPESLVAMAIDRPEAALSKSLGNAREAHEIFILALGRMARTNPEQASRALHKAESKLAAPEQALGWAQIALQASIRLMPESLPDYWSKASGAPLSAEGHQWKVRMALRAGDWKLVESAIDAMPTELRNDPAWVYWRARAMKAEGKSDEAQPLFLSIADQTHFYGQLAAEALGKKISIPKGAAPLTAEDIAPMAGNLGFRRAFKFFEMNLRFEAIREWNWELRSMNERQHLAAAEFARQNNVLDRMVNTSDRTKSETDYTQRFPSPFRELMYSTTKSLGIDMAWVYGLIRQESRFIMNARSHVGASGLMQLMPNTARYVAKKIGMTDYNHSQVNDIDTNIQLGTNYLNMVLTDLDGSQTLASAAYNAGPGRPRAWRASLKRPVEGAIFAESIPFHETRGYVKNVLSNATYYAALFEGKPQSLVARLGVVTPKGYVPSERP